MDMDDYYDTDDQWLSEGRCIVCKNRSEQDICSTLCGQIMALRDGDDCYA